MLKTSTQNKRSRNKEDQGKNVIPTKLRKIFISNGDTMDVKDNGGRTPLHIAAEVGNIDICHLWISKGAVLDARNSYKQTPLHVAVATGNLDICQLLISNGATIDARNSYK